MFKFLLTTKNGSYRSCLANLAVTFAVDYFESHQSTLQKITQ